MGLLRNIIIAILLFSAVSFTIFGLYGDMYDNYDSVLARNEQLLGKYNKLNSSEYLANTISDKIYNTTGVVGVTATETMAADSFGSARTFISDSRPTMEKIAHAVEDDLNVPRFWTRLGLTLIGIVILFTIISGFVRHKW